jgi:hypothetical protein
MGYFTEFIDVILATRREDTRNDIESLQRGIEHKESDLRYLIKGIQNDRVRLMEYNKKVEGLDDFTKKLTQSIESITKMKYVNSVDYETSSKSLMIYIDGSIRAYTQGNDEIILGPLILQLYIIKNEVAVFCDEDNGGGFGYWTDHDPHPHVSGSTGKPCLGDVESPIALAFSSYDYDIVAMLMLEFLQSVNEGDPAGAKYKGWAHTTEDGEFFEAQNGNLNICSICDNEVDEDDMGICDSCGADVCNDCTMYIEYEDRHICTDCYNDYYDECTTCETRRNAEDLHYCKHCSEAVCGDCVMYYDDEPVCPSCYEEHYTVCEICEELNDNGEILKCQECGKWVCKDCIEDGICNICIEDREDVLEDIQEEEDADNDCEGECIGNCLACMEEKTRELLSRVDEALQDEEQPLGLHESICFGCKTATPNEELTKVLDVVNGSYGAYCIRCVEGGLI